MSTDRQPSEHSQRTYLPQPREQRKGAALCLSGGGYRASLFDLGAMRRLDELGILSQIDTITSVSGGSIAAAFVAAHVSGPLGGRWPEPGERIPGFEEGIANPLREMTTRNNRTLPFLRRFNPLDLRKDNPVSDALARRYAESFSDRTVASLPNRPRFVFCATDLQFRCQWVLDGGKNRHGSELIGYESPIPNEWTVSQAVAASSCFPGLFPPIELEIDPALFKGGTYEGTDREELCRGIELSDGGVIDNLGLEPVWADHAVVLVSDGSPSFGPSPDLGPIWPGIRPIIALLEQATVVRKRWLIANFEMELLDGVYWGIASLPSHYDPPPGTKVYPDDIVEHLISQIRIELDAFSEGERAVLENHGYLMCDLAIRKHEPQLVRIDAPLNIPFRDWMDANRVRGALAKSHRHKLLGRGRWW